MTLSTLQSTIFTPKCAGCHGSGGEANLDLRSGQSFANLVNVPSRANPSILRVKPFDAPNSYLHQFLASGHRSSSVTTTDKANIDSWIMAGAANN